MANEKRTVQVVLDVGLGPDGTRALGQVEQALNKAGHAWAYFNNQGQLNQAGMGIGGSITQPMVSGPVGGYGNAVGGRLGGGGGGSGGMGGYFGGIAGRAMAAATIVSAVAGGTKSAALSAYDPYITSSQAGRSFLGAMPFGETIRGFVDAFGGRAAGMQQADIAGQFGALNVQSAASLAQFNLGYRPMQAGREALAGAFGRQNPINMGYINRSTEAGRQEFDLASRLLPVKRDIARADRESAQSSAERKEAEDQLVKLNRDSVKLKEQAYNIEHKIYQDSGSGEERQRLLRDQENALQAIKANADLRRAASEQIVNAKVNEQQKIAAASMARTRELGAKADYLEGRADVVSQAGTSFGAMNPFDRQFAVQAVEAVLQYGPDRVSPDMLAAARSTGSRAVEDRVREAGLADPSFRRLQGLDPSTFGAPGTKLEDLRREAAGLRDAAGSQSFYAEERLSRAARDAGKDLGIVVTNVINQLKQAMKDEILNQIKLGKNQ